MISAIWLLLLLLLLLLRWRKASIQTGSLGNLAHAHRCGQPFYSEAIALGQWHSYQRPSLLWSPALFHPELGTVVASITEGTRGGG
ncbi:uncharacterized protein UDID_17305 [Ustilago sp. UG-2017a]|nr:uncharacterized protein UDID_17305 [Ustilago sp. UG-2017a]